MKFTLTDNYYDSDLQELSGSIKIVDGHMLISFDGYGDCMSNDGDGSPLLVGLYNNQLKVFMWDDINKEDVTHIISLEGAKENKRVLEDSQ
jgi:hypothetical protein